MTINARVPERCLAIILHASWRTRVLEVDRKIHWKRSEFESASDPRPLAEAMSRELTNRLISSSDPEIESRSIVDELRSYGHELFSWDESTDFQVWGDSHVPPTGKNRIIIEFNYPEDEPPSVEVTFGPWPK